jgi:1-acyl-sn-glycerol-3-phosphate acyltransferase
MLNFLPEPVLGTLTMILYIINTFLWGTLLFPTTLLKIVPINRLRTFCSRVLDATANNWILCSNGILRLTKKIYWEVHGGENLDPKDWYLVIPNHQTWADILVLVKIFYRKIPFPKFFMKKELIWVPFIGVGCWALDYPFMKRYSKEFLEKNPHMKGKDIEITKKACEKYKDMPVSIINFVEGTRFSIEKQIRQKSPFRHLLKPKAGGMAFVLSTMGDILNHILNVTIYYVDGAKTFWQFLCSKVSRVIIWVEKLNITEELLGNYEEDPEFRKRMQEWINKLWREKDTLLEGGSR